MGFDSLFLAVGAFWAVVHAIHYRWVRRPDRSPILPITLSSHATRRKPHNTNIGLHKLSLRIEYVGFNRLHDRFTSGLARTQHSRFNRGLALFYDLGSVLGALGMVAALIALLALATKLCYATFLASSPVPIHEQQPGSVMKRDTLPPPTPPSSVYPSHANIPAPIVHFLIPGLTVPLSHLTPLLFALFVSQVIHEAGHAIAAALDAVPLLSVGASLTVMMPSAFVSLSSSSMYKLPPRARLRIISAGALHNLLLWAVLAVLASTSLSTTLWSLTGYESVRHYARIVTAINSDSPLNSHLPIGALVTHLNDDPLASPTEDLWVRYLTQQQTRRSSVDLGWCAEISWFEGLSDECCKTNPTDAGHSCFTAVSLPHSQPMEKCLSPHFFMSDSSTVAPQRCDEAVDCRSGHVCIRPRPDEEILRITLWIPPHLMSEGLKQEQTVIWSGPWEEVLEDVQVGTHMPRFRFLPLWFPALVNAFFWYLSTLTLSLYFFNLLPLSFLDGGQLLDAMFDWFHHYARPSMVNDFALEGLEAGMADARYTADSPTLLRVKGVVLNGASFGVTAVMGLCGIVALWNTISQ